MLGARHLGQGVGTLSLGEDPLRETLAPALHHGVNAIDFAEVVSQSDDHLQYLTISAPICSARARIIQSQRGKSILDYPWSSLARGYALPPKQRATGLDVTGGLELFGYADSARNRR